MLLVESARLAILVDDDGVIWTGRYADAKDLVINSDVTPGAHSIRLAIINDADGSARLHLLHAVFFTVSRAALTVEVRDSSGHTASVRPAYGRA